MARSTRAVIESHLRLRAEGDLEADLAQNYHEDVVVLHADSAARGLAAIRAGAKDLEAECPGMRFTIDTLSVEGEYALITWHAEGADAVLVHGVDSFAVRDDRIAMQTIYYAVVKQPAA